MSCTACPPRHSLVVSGHLNGISGLYWRSGSLIFDTEDKYHGTINDAVLALRNVRKRFREADAIC